MAKPTISISNNTSTFTADAADTHFILHEAYTVETSSLYAINAGNDVDGRSFEINGGLFDATIGLYTNSANSGASTIRVGKTGVISTDAIGINAVGDHDVIVNHGSIAAWDASSYGLLLKGTGIKATNTGAIRADTGIGLDGSGTLINSGTITGNAGGTRATGIGVDSNTGDVTRIVNSGSITGSNHSIYAYDGREIITNSGIINGDLRTGAGRDSISSSGEIQADIAMGDGNDRFIGRAGSTFTSLTMEADNDTVDVRGMGAIESNTIYGGDGDDTILISSSDVVLVEFLNQGADAVRSSASFTLGDNFETLVLLGKGKINGTGNTLDNRLTGNGADNRLSGLAGEDRLDGGRGNDTLKGGGAADSFVFKAHAGDDTIADFKDGTDSIDLSHYKGIDSFADIKGHMQQVGGDLVITLLQGDTITLGHTKAAEIGGQDFDF